MYDSLGYFYHACQNILDNSDLPALDWAIGYARHGRTIEDKHAAHTQAVYILGNIKYWRGPIANETKSILKNIIKYWK